MIFRNLLLAFQLENYKNIRFLKFIYTHPFFWFSGSKRQVLDYTQKAKLILVLSLLFCILEIIWIVFLLSWIFKIISLVFVFLLLPFYFIVANIIISPLDVYLKNKIIIKAKEKIKKYPKLKIIAITGSMGKTTTKEILNTILAEKYNVLTTEGTKNTPLWISRLILWELSEQHEIFIVEMWAYNKWNIAELCNIVNPNISVLTGITLQHLERFWSLNKIIDTKFEILEALSENDFAVIDISTQWVQKWLSQKKDNLAVKNIQTVKKWIPFTYKENLWGITFELDRKEIKTKILSSYIVETLQICWKIWEYLGMNFEEFQKWITKLDFVEHRMQLIHNKQSNIYIIDDSFNGNIEWIQSILHLMKHAPFTGRKILVAGWVVELWEESYTVNSKLGAQMWEVSDTVLLVEWPVGDAIQKWLLETWFPKTQIQIYKTPLALHEDMKNITKPGDMIIFQNDLPDNYL